MREIDLTPLLKRGIINSPDNPLRNDEVLVASECRATDNGLVPIEAITQLLAGVEGRPPTGQLFKFNDGSAGCKLVFGIDSNVYKISLVAGVWGAAAYTFYDCRDLSDVGWAADPVEAIAGVGNWHFADLGTSWLMTNGASLLCRTDFANAYSGAVRTYILPIADITSLCAFRGRLYQASYSLPAAYTARLLALTDAVTYPATITGNKAITWSSIGYDDAFFQMFPFMLTAEKLKELRKRKEFGSIDWTYVGDTIYKLKPLGDYVIAYSERGIGALRPVESPVGAHQFIDITSNFGVYARGCVGGDIKKHIIVDSRKGLWQLTPDLQLKQITEGLTLGANVSVVHDDSRGTYYIGDNSSSYLLSPSGGLTSQGTHVGAVYRVGGALKGMYRQPLAPSSILFETGPIKVNGTITGLWLRSNDNTAYSVKLQHRMASDAAWEDIGYSVPRKNGYCDFIKTVDEVKVFITSTSVSKEINELKLFVGEDAKLSIGDLLS